MVILPSLTFIYNRKLKGDIFMDTKICSKCKQELPIDQFSFRNKAKGTRRAECKACHNAYMKQRYQEKREEIREVKKELSCVKCGYNKCIEALDFHHINPDEKENTVARMLANSYGIDRTYKEMSKCVVLCANCHREFHYLEKENNISLEEFLKK